MGMPMPYNEPQDLMYGQPGVGMNPNMAYPAQGAPSYPPSNVIGIQLHNPMMM
jgi:hypothetical protein